MITILSFGGVYYALNRYNAVLVVGVGADAPLTFLDSVYFSFITATSTGYGDIIPLGIARILALVEVTMSLLLFGVLVSKIVSVKQEVLLQEIYDISFEEKISRIRSALYLFRSDVSKLIEKIDSNSISQRRISDLWITFTTLENSMYEIIKIIRTQKHQNYVRQVSDLDIELILGSISLSLKKARDLFVILEEKNVQWRNDTIGGMLEAVNINITELSTSLKNKEPNQKIIDKLGEVVALASEITPKLKLTVSAANN
ncbi:two pore domain potassium channel family protein [Candidatus Woesearchaeota archaeon]|nr:two pore domain potassium channel family protein [Candidatus Woesearchaeota archaeon]